MYICEWCRQVIEPDDPGVVRAVEQKDVSGFGRREVNDGVGVYFHEGCFPTAIRNTAWPGNRRSSRVWESTGR